MVKEGLLGLSQMNPSVFLIFICKNVNFGKTDDQEKWKGEI